MKIQLAGNRARAAAVGVGVVVAAVGAGAGLQLVGGTQPTVAEAQAEGAAVSGESGAVRSDGHAHEHTARMAVAPAATTDTQAAHTWSGRITPRGTLRHAARADQPPPTHGNHRDERGRQDHGNGQDHGNPQDEAVSATAERFLTEVAGLARPAPGPVERSGDTAEATFYGRGEGGHVARGMVTVVSLRRHEGGWAATGARAPTIEVDSPAPGATVGSPLVVSGRAHAYEGTVHVRVVETLEDGYGELGRGFVTGAGDMMGPFEGEIPFAPPSGATGWVAFVEDSGADGATTRATVVPVELTYDPGCPEHAPPPPLLEAPSWNPEVVLEDGWLRLPAGAGTLTVTVRATDADEVDLVLTPTGTGTAPYAEVVDTSIGSDGVFTLEMEYADAPLLGHLSLVARGPGGETAVDLAGVYHPDPQDPQES